MIPIAPHDNHIYNAIEFNPRGSQCLRRILGINGQIPMYVQVQSCDFPVFPLSNRDIFHKVLLNER